MNFQSYFPNTWSEEETQLNNAVVEGDIDRLEAILQTVEPSDSLVQRLMAAATGSLRLPMLQHLLTRFPSVSLDEETVRAAVQSGSIPIFSALLARDSSIIRTQFGRMGTPLTQACMSRQPIEFLRFLLEAGADLNQNPGTTSYPLAIVATFYEDTAALDLLLEHGHKLQGTGALGLASHWGNEAMIRHLLARGVKIEEDDTGWGLKYTALHTAAEYGQAGCVKALLEHGADVNVLDHTGRTPLAAVEEMEKRKEDRSEVIRLLKAGLLVHKLGYGSYSTIWLARDDKKSKYVAIKIGTADSDQKEVDTLARIDAESREWEHQGRCLIPPVLDRFKISGPNGTHPCLVTTPMRCSLSDANSDFGLFQLDVARSMAAQLATTVAHLHELGYAHGDLHLGNILLQPISTLDSLSEEELYAKFGAPEPEAVIREDGKPLSPVFLHMSKITLSDFGVAFRPATENRLESYTPLVIRPPEAWFERGKPLSAASDIWSLGCTIWAMLGCAPLVNGWTRAQDAATLDMNEFLGPLPQEWWEKWEARHKYFAEHGKRKESDMTRSWDQRFQSTIQEPRLENGVVGALDQQEKEAFFEMLTQMVSYDPTRRLTAGQVLDTRWMQKWAAPSMHETFRRRP